MDIVGFIGVYDKIDLMLNVSKILTFLDKKVLIIDATINQKAKYIVPYISPTAKYITTFEDIDVAIGFENIQEIKEYIGENDKLPYDIVLIDIDTSKALEKFEIKKAKKNFFVTAFDTYSIKKGIQIFSEIEEPIELTKILFSKDMLKEDDDYLNFTSLGYKIIWSEYRIYFPLENGDLSVIMENQRLAKIKFKRLSAQYKEGMIQISQEIEKGYKEGTIRKTIKTIEKGV